MSGLGEFADKDRIHFLSSHRGRPHEANQNRSLHPSLVMSNGSTTLTWEDTQLQLVSQDIKLLRDFQRFKYANCTSGFEHEYL
jgi:hypothetical protein